MSKPLHEYIPKRLKIAGKTVKVELIGLEQAQEEEVWGQFMADEARIQICAEHTPEFVLDTLLHEILHACYAYWNMQDHDDEERIVHTMASALQSLYTENANLLKCIQMYTKAARRQQQQL